MILILILGAVISIFLHEVMDSVIIVAVITINALIGGIPGMEGGKSAARAGKNDRDESCGQA